MMCEEFLYISVSRFVNTMSSLGVQFQPKNGRKNKSEKNGSVAFAKVEKKPPPSQPGLEPGFSDGCLCAHVQGHASVSLL